MYKKMRYLMLCGVGALTAFAVADTPDHKSGPGVQASYTTDAGIVQLREHTELVVKLFTRLLSKIEQYLQTTAPNSDRHAVHNALMALKTLVQGVDTPRINSFTSRDFAELLSNVRRIIIQLKTDVLREPIAKEQQLPAASTDTNALLEQYVALEMMLDDAIQSINQLTLTWYNKAIRFAGVAFQTIVTPANMRRVLVAFELLRIMKYDTVAGWERSLWGISQEEYEKDKAKYDAETGVLVAIKNWAGSPLDNRTIDVGIGMSDETLKMTANLSPEAREAWYKNLESQISIVSNTVRNSKVFRLTTSPGVFKGSLEKELGNAINLKDSKLIDIAIGSLCYQQVKEDVTHIYEWLSSAVASTYKQLSGEEPSLLPAELKKAA
jgi:hypothetical protein